MKQFFKAFAVILVVVALIGGLVFMFLQDCFMNEVERYSIGMEITHAEESAYYMRSHGVKVKRTFYLRGDDKATAVGVDGETYARFEQGDWVEVEFQVIENIITHEIIERPRIIGAMEKN